MLEPLPLNVRYVNQGTYNIVFRLYYDKESFTQLGLCHQCPYVIRVPNYMPPLSVSKPDRVINLLDMFNPDTIKGQIKKVLQPLRLTYLNTSGSSEHLDINAADGAILVPFIVQTYRPSDFDLRSVVVKSFSIYRLLMDITAQGNVRINYQGHLVVVDPDLSIRCEPAGLDRVREDSEATVEILDNISNFRYQYFLFFHEKSFPLTIRIQMELLYGLHGKDSCLGHLWDETGLRVMFAEGFPQLNEEDVFNLKTSMPWWVKQTESIKKGAELARKFYGRYQQKVAEDRDNRWFGHYRTYPAFHDNTRRIQSFSHILLHAAGQAIECYSGCRTRKVLLAMVEDNAGLKNIVNQKMIDLRRQCREAKLSLVFEDTNDSLWLTEEQWPMRNSQYFQNILKCIDEIIDEMYNAHFPSPNPGADFPQP